MTARIWRTDDAPAAERTALWRDSMHALFGGLRTDFYGDAVCSGTVVAHQLGDMPVARLQASRHCVVREPSPTALSDPGYLKILAPFEGEAWVYQHNRRAIATPGEWVTYDTSQPYVVENPLAVDHLVLMVPRNVVANTKIGVEPLMARTLSARGLSRVALEAMRSAYLELAFMPPHLAHCTSDAVGQLIKLSLLQLGGVESELSQRASLQERVYRYIDQRLADPALTVSRIAIDLGCSKRLLHAAFSDADETLSTHILARRVEACARDLVNPRLHARPVVEIATSWGFVNASHFSRAFRARMGMSPRAYRERAQVAWVKT